MISPDDVAKWLAGRNWQARYGAETEAELTDLFEAVLVQGNVPVAQAHLRAVEYAATRSGALITGLEDTTREYVRDLVGSTIESGGTVKQLTSALSDGSVFSPARARTIARTETTKSLRTGKREIALDQGRDEQHWQTNGPDACPDCQANEDAGWISVDEDFPSGEDTHPSCECNITYRTAALHEDKGEED